MIYRVRVRVRVRRSCLAVSVGLAIIRSWVPFSQRQLRSTINVGQVVHTYVPLSPSSITWYWSKDGDILQLGRWPYGNPSGK